MAVHSLRKTVARCKNEEIQLMHSILLRKHVFRRKNTKNIYKAAMYIDFITSGKLSSDRVFCS